VGTATINERTVFRDMNRRLNKIRHVALDMDGTIYKGKTLFATTDPFLELLGQLGIGYTFLTNNPSKSVTDYLSHLEELGIPATQEQLYTSAQAPSSSCMKNGRPCDGCLSSARPVCASSSRRRASFFCQTVHAKPLTRSSWDSTAR
jgi:hypothetical protein